jgi:hypothetical protein
MAAASGCTAPGSHPLSPKRQQVRKPWGGSTTLENWWPMETPDGIFSYGGFATNCQRGPKASLSGNFIDTVIKSATSTFQHNDNFTLNAQFHKHNS